MTIDTEEEWDWSKGFPVENYSVRNTRNIPKFQAFCNDLGVRVTYFIDYAIVSDKESVKCFQELSGKGGCEIGAHLHTWVTPPIEEEIRPETTYAVNLPPNLLRRKLANLTQKLEAEFGKRPRAFRSGRWGMNGNLLKMLCEEGYRIDSSVFPFWADSTFSFYDVPDIPYWPDLRDSNQEGTQREIFEIPVTSGFTRTNFGMWHKFHQFFAAKPWSTFHAIGILSRLSILRKLCLSPELHNAFDMVRLIKTCLKRGHRVIHMFLHSSSLLVGGSPYVSNEDEERNLYQNIFDAITYLKTRSDVSFCTLAEAEQQYLQEENV